MSEELYAIFADRRMERLPAGARPPADAVGLARREDLPTMLRAFGALDAGPPVPTEPTEADWRAAIGQMFGPNVVRVGLERSAQRVLAAIDPEEAAYCTFLAQVNR